MKSLMLALVLTIIPMTQAKAYDQEALFNTLTSELQAAYGMVCVKLEDQVFRCSRSSNPKHGFKLNIKSDDKAFEVGVKVVGKILEALGGQPCVANELCAKPILDGVLNYVSKSLMANAVCNVAPTGTQVMNLTYYKGDCADVYGKISKINVTAKQTKFEEGAYIVKNIKVRFPK